MLYRFVFLVFTMCAFASAAESQIIIGNGVGKECYQTAITKMEPRNYHIDICTKAIESNALILKDLSATYVNRGILNMRARKFADALEDYEKAIRISPRLGAAFLNKGAALIASGRPSEAIPILKKSIELETHDIEAAHFNLGMAYELTGEITEAYLSLQKALEIRPDWDLPKMQLERYAVVSEG